MVGGSRSTDFFLGRVHHVSCLDFVLADATPQVVVEWDDQESPDQVNLLVYDEVGLGQLFDDRQAPSQNQIAGVTSLVGWCKVRTVVWVSLSPRSFVMNALPYSQEPKPKTKNVPDAAALLCRPSRLRKGQVPCVSHSLGARRPSGTTGCVG